MVPGRFAAEEGGTPAGDKSGIRSVSNINTIAKPRLPSEGVEMRARVKWFNTEKGFGFVAPVDGGGDAFVHASALQKAGLAQLPVGAELVCEIVEGPKGLQVVRILDAPMVLPEQSGEEGVTGAVKWFAPEKGFGFILADDGGKDVFVHKNVLRRCGIEELAEGQRVTMNTSPTPKGREAVWIQID